MQKSVNLFIYRKNDHFTQKRLFGEVFDELPLTFVMAGAGGCCRCESRRRRVSRRGGGRVESALAAEMS